MEVSMTNHEIRQCARRCIEKFETDSCEQDCLTCRYNVHNYDADREKAQSLFEYEYKAWRKEQEDKIVKRTIFVLAAAVVLLVSIYARQPDKNMNVMAALERTEETIRDVNGDGLINCIDYAVRFYEIVPGTKIYRSNDPAFNHLFVLAYDDKRGGYQFIEPQHHQDDKYLMRQVWGHEIMDSVHIYEEKSWEKFAQFVEW